MSDPIAPAAPATEPTVTADLAPPVHPATPAVAPSAPSPATPAPKNKFENVGKTVGLKARGVMAFFHTAGEQIRGNINAALDGAGDAIAGRKNGAVANKSVNTDTSASAPAATQAEPATVAAQAEPATVAAQAEPATVAAQAESAPVPAAQPSNDGIPVATTPATTEPKPAAAATEKRYPVGQIINKSLKRTATLVQRVAGNLRSNASRKADAFGNTIAQGKQQASKRFSKSSKPSAGQEPANLPEQVPAPDTSAPAEIKVPEPAPIPSTTTPADTVAAPLAPTSTTQAETA